MSEFISGLISMVKVAHHRDEAAGSRPDTPERPTGSGSGTDADSMPNKDLHDSFIPDNLICAVCLQLMCEPVMWPTEALPGTGSCGHLLCKRCTKQCAARPSPTCPLCRTPAAGDLGVRELFVDQPTVELMKQEVPVMHAERMDALQREEKLKASLSELLLFPFGRRCDYKTGKLFSVTLRTPAQLWLVVQVSLACCANDCGTLYSPDYSSPTTSRSQPPSHPPTDSSTRLASVSWAYSSAPRRPAQTAGTPTCGTCRFASPWPSSRR